MCVCVCVCVAVWAVSSGGQCFLLDDTVHRDQHLLMAKQILKRVPLIDGFVHGHLITASD